MGTRRLVVSRKVDDGDCRRASDGSSPVTTRYALILRRAVTGSDHLVRGGSPISVPERHCAPQRVPFVAGTTRQLFWRVATRLASMSTSRLVARPETCRRVCGRRSAVFGFGECSDDCARAIRGVNGFGRGCDQPIEVLTASVHLALLRRLVFSARRSASSHTALGGCDGTVAWVGSLWLVPLIRRVAFSARRTASSHTELGAFDRTAPRVTALLPAPLLRRLVFSARRNASSHNKLVGSDRS